MKAALIMQAGQGPVYSDFPAPEFAEGENLISVTAAALSPVTRSRASGTHYSSSGQIPFVVGIDGVGRLADGRRVYFMLPTAPFGSMAEQTRIKASQCIALPADLDDVTAAAIANPGMSSWAALRERAQLQVGETVLINGATGTSGRLAVQIARYLGAKKVIATGRNIEALQSLTFLGADLTIPLVEDGEALEKAFLEPFHEGIDVVLDYLWGSSMEHMLIAAARAGKAGVPIRFVQIGTVSAQSISLPGAVLRSSAIQLMGSGIGSVPADRLLKVAEGVLQAAIPGKFEIATTRVPLAKVADVWPTATSQPRTVFLP
ncbi:zinc-binding alcohol dehydrogenase family protein [Ktedonosporobacter rubrisoli]|uniref:Zinc-binding alcohol dehydrogenase family protein n=1 Tax=Ktedonosporobacter rubrisoli TaxID=2509675 RepID=A0A4V0YZV9_KTERU|nr:zinc-binding alcohol dehydrogenase family protein [Ktedonosporobacter rubrisoli]QBD81081.1 zinc-binding alcohol dehydrogenase family protein [Ktedonosporobacter rubrisoli]